MGEVHFNTTKARELRRQSTPAERKLWRYLHSHEYFSGYHFKRQKPFHPYIVDFYCHRSRLVIELDGAQHSDHLAKMYDGTRTRFLESKGLQVIRFWNGEVIFHLEAVLEEIKKNL